MKPLSINILLICAFSLLPLVLNAESSHSNQDLQKARSLVKVFGGDLKPVLKTSMKTGGPVKALEVCNLEAGPISEKNSLLSGWQMTRTSLKTRNEKNKPDDWELKTLLQFEKRKIAGENLKKIEYSEVVKEGDKKVFRYMKAIPTSGLCVTCHGSDLNGELTKKLKSLYPHDKAIGFNVGDIRGAFSLRKVKN